MARKYHRSWRQDITNKFIILTNFIFSGLNLTPEANEAGAAFTPKLNAFANNLTRWDLTVDDVQFGGGYPGSVGCNNVIPHAKWHAQTSAALSDMMRLMDFVLKLEKQHM